MNQILLGDCLDVLKTLPDESVDSIVTDPPYGLGTREPTGDEIVAYLRGGELDTAGDFMGKDWSIPPVAVWRECLRVLQPGGHLLCFGGTRTFDLISIGIRAAGFECRDTIASQFGVQCLQWIQGQGFPKSLDICKAIEKAGVDPETAQQWEGWGTALKPSWEPILVFRKPIAEATVAKQVLKTGAGAINIDACRVHAHGERTIWSYQSVGSQGCINHVGTTHAGEPVGSHKTLEGRWPANLVFTHLPTCKVTGSKRVRAPVINRFDDGMKPFGDGAGHKYTSEQTGDHDGNETIPVYECEDGCPVRALDAQSGVRTSGTGDRRSGIGPIKRATAHGHSSQTYGAESRPSGTEMIWYGDSGGASRYFNQFQPDTAKSPVYECADGCSVKALDEQSGVSVSVAAHRGRGRSAEGSYEGWKRPAHEHYTSTVRGHDDEGGASRFFSQFQPDPINEPAYERAEGCPVKALDEQSGVSRSLGGKSGGKFAGAVPYQGALSGLNPGSTAGGFGDTGGASRYFTQFEPDAPFIYSPKVSKAERDRGLPKGTNKHPTVKPLAVMRWLVKLVTPKNVFVCPVCDGHNQSMRGMQDTVSAKAERFEGLLDQVSEQNCGQGRTQESSETVPDLSPGLQLPAQAPDVLQPQMQGAGGSRGARKKVRELRKAIPSEQPEPGAQEKVLLESLRLQITDEESGTQALSGLSNAIHPEGSEDVSTTTTLLSEVRGGNSLSQTTTQNHVDESGVSNALSAGAPHGDKTRDAVGTPPGNGGAPGADAAAVGGSSSPERDQRRQQNRESPGAAETRARSSAASIDVPSLSGRYSNPRTCPRCGSGLISAPGVVLDPYCGSGSTLVAAMSEGFNFIGIERDPESHAVAVLRTTRKPDVFDTLEELA